MSLRVRLWNALRPNRLQRDLERELAFHIAEKIDELQENGMSRAEAERAARKQFGNFAIQTERTRDMDVNAAIEDTIRNLRYAKRALARTPAFAVTVVLTLALGIGANSAVFSAIYAVLLRPLPFPEGDQLMKLTQEHPKIPQMFVAPARLEDWNRLAATFDGISGHYIEDTSETSGELPERLKRAWVAPRFFQVLGVAPALGRWFTAEEEKFGGPPAVLISDRFWRRRFGADPAAVGKTIRAPRTAFAIVGVMPAGFQFPNREVDLWSPSPPDAPYAQSRANTWFNAIGRLKEGVSAAAAIADIKAVQTRLGEQYPRTDAEISVKIQPLKEATVGGFRKSLWLLYGSVSLLLLIACTNIAALLLSRATARRHEIAVRFSLGASRATVVRQLLTEVLILAIAGAALGLPAAGVAARVFRLLSKDLPRIDEIRLDGSVVLYSLVCAVAVTVLCGLLPAMQTTRRGLSVAMVQGGRSQVAGRSRAQFALVGVQVALAVTLLAGAGLLLRSLQQLGRVSPGFDPQHVLTFRISTTWAETNGRDAVKQRTDRILGALRAVPGVQAATTAISLPGVPENYPIELKTTEGRAGTDPKLIAEARWVTPAYFATLRIPVIAGELCREEAKTPTVMVNRSFASRYLGGTAIGRHLVQAANPGSAAAEIRGIVADARETGLHLEPGPTAYFCETSMQPGTHFVVRVQGDTGTMAGMIRRKIQEIEPQRSVYNIAALTDQISDAYAENRLRTILLGFFALTAVGLASVGLYGTLSYMVRVRQREVALRMALGALRIQVVRQFLVQGIAVALLGCVAGAALVAIFAQVLSGMLYGVAATDMLTMAGVIALVLAVAAAASLLPSIRAARLEPMQVLREE